MTSLSLIIIARNEEHCIARCLQSASFADQIVLVSNSSTDRTLEIARGFDATIIETPDWPGFGAQKARALAAATGDWVLSLDADEWLEAPAAAEIRAAIAEPGGRSAFHLPRRSRFCGTVVRHGGWSPDYVLRLFRREAGAFTPDRVHEHVVVTGPVGRLREPIEHDSILDMDDAHDKVGRYAAAAAEQLLRQGRTSSAAKALLRGGWAFLRSYIVRRGFADGSTGIMVAAYQASYTYQKWARLAVLDARTEPSSHAGQGPAAS